MGNHSRLRRRVESDFEGEKTARHAESAMDRRVRSRRLMRHSSNPVVTSEHRNGFEAGGKGRKQRRRILNDAFQEPIYRSTEEHKGSRGSTVEIDGLFIGEE